MSGNYFWAKIQFWSSGFRVIFVPEIDFHNNFLFLKHDFEHGVDPVNEKIMKKLKLIQHCEVKGEHHRTGNDKLHKII